MNEAYRNSSYDFILISDSGIRSKFFHTKNWCVYITKQWILLVKEDTLLDMVNHMSEKTGIVHQMPFTCDRNSFAATLEKVGIGIYFTDPLLILSLSISVYERSDKYLSLIPRNYKTVTN